MKPSHQNDDCRERHDAVLPARKARPLEHPGVESARFVSRQVIAPYQKKSESPWCTSSRSSYHCRV